jgi:hypothetical protein
MPKMSEIDAMRKARAQNEQRSMPYQDELDRFWKLFRMLLTKHGVGAPSDLEGTWACTLDQDWRIEINGHAEPVKGVPPFSVYVMCVRQPAAIIDTDGATFVEREGVTLPILNHVLQLALQNTTNDQKSEDSAPS